MIRGANVFGQIFEEKYGNNQDNADRIKAMVEVQHVPVQVAKVTDRFMLFYVASPRDLTRTFNILHNAGYAPTDLDMTFNSSGDRFSVRKGNQNVVFFLRSTSPIGNIGIDLGIQKGVKDIVTAPGAFAQNLVNAQGMALQTATGSFDILAKVVVGVTIVVAAAITFPMMIDGIANTYDRIGESRVTSKRTRDALAGQSSLI